MSTRVKSRSTTFSVRIESVQSVLKDENFIGFLFACLFAFKLNWTLFL